MGCTCQEDGVNVLVGCEYSGIVRDAFIERGHDAISCDILPSESRKGIHWQRDIFETLERTRGTWDMMIAHPPCTAVCVAGNRYYSGTQERLDGIEFIERLWEQDIPKICIENPVGVLSTQSKMGPPAQYIQPWQYGHGEQKKTGLWLKGLPKLRPTEYSEGRHQKVWLMGPSPDRGKERSRFFPGIAEAMAEQWG